jgi:hypothetical protein
MQSLESVDWVGLQKFLKTQSPISRCKILQSMHNWQNTGYQKRQFSLSSAGHNQCSDTGNVERCPLGCGHVEHPFHYMYCQEQEEMSIQQDKELLTIKKELGKLKTAPSLKEAILEGPHAILDHTEYELDENSNPLLFDDAHSCLLQKQSAIGWEYFMKGFMTKEWGIIQGQYYQYTQLNSRTYTSKQWVVHLLTISPLQTGIYSNSPYDIG